MTANQRDVMNVPCIRLFEQAGYLEQSSAALLVIVAAGLTNFQSDLTVLHPKRLLSIRFDSAPVSTCVRVAGKFL